MGLQDRDYYREHWKEQRAQEEKSRGRARMTMRGRSDGLPRWLTFIVWCLAAYGFVAAARDAGVLLRHL